MPDDGILINITAVNHFVSGSLVPYLEPTQE